MEQVTKRIKDQLRAVRDYGRVNMMSANDVQREANDMGAYELVVWIEDHRRGSYRVEGWIDLLNAVFAED